MVPSDPVKLEFSDKYTQQHATEYLHKHRNGFFRRFSSRRDMQLARNALKLAGEPTLVLDLPCGAGRFWPILAEHPNRMIIGADNSPHMLQLAAEEYAGIYDGRFRTLQTSAFHIGLGANAVDCIFCMRLLHHVADAAHRLTLLREFHRVTRDSVIISLWVNGNYKAWKRERLERKRCRAGEASTNRFVMDKALAEAEFRRAGFSILGHQDFLPGYAMWRVYTLSKNETA